MSVPNCHTHASPAAHRSIAGVLSVVVPGQALAHTTITLDAPPLLIAGAVTVGVLATLALGAIIQRRRADRQMLRDAHRHHAVSASLAQTVMDVEPEPSTRAEAATMNNAGADLAALNTVIATLDEGVIISASNGQTLASNDAAAHIFDLDPAQMDAFHIDRPPVKFLRTNGLACPSASLPPQQSLADGQVHEAEFNIVQPNGTRQWVKLHARPIVLAGAAVVTAITDVTHQRQTDARLRLADKAIEHSPDAIMITTAEGLILRVNPAFTRLTGYRLDEVIGHSPALLRSGQHDTAFYTAMWNSVRRSGRWEGEIWNRHKRGHLFAERLSISAVEDTPGHVSHYVAVFSDITEAKTEAARISHLAQHDALTGLPNRSLMSDRLNHALHRSQRHRAVVALLFLDLDRFKTVNDTFGHAVGDLLLQQVAARLTGCVRESDSVGRLSGDEFMVVLTDLVDAEQAGQVARKILASLDSPFEIEGHRIQATFSIGIALYPNDAGSAKDLHHHADTALYHAKASGRNAFRYFTEAMNTRAEQRLNMEHHLRGAIAKGELSLLFQPLTRIDDGRVVAMEALCRWHSPVLGDILPDSFIPVAEGCGLIVDLDYWVLEHACHELSIWQTHGATEVGVAVNLSSLHFRREGLVDEVRAVLARTQIPASRLELELSESTLLQGGPEVTATLNSLKAMGVHLVINDFGVGYSSLAHLRRYQIDRLKIDRRFIQAMEHTGDDAAIVRALIELGQSMRIEVLAEGVETDGQRRGVLAAGCLLAQGQLMGAPMTAETTLALLTAPTTLRPTQR
ncbi:EAL domain-containing protein [Zoogloeaceae bacterium G21618-S1]|nr:EAL domain-containing protein [Zoogloeaceae bacterium G21618-S1]